MGRKDKYGTDENANVTDADGVEGTWAEKNSNASGEPSKADETKPLNLEKSEPPATLKPPDRREEQAIRNMTPLGASHAIKPESKEGEPLRFKSKSDRLAHTLERARQVLLERNAHLGQQSLMNDIDAALAEYSGEQAQPLGSFATPSTASTGEASSSTSSSSNSGEIAAP